MSMRYKGGIISSTIPTTSSGAAGGMWSIRQQLKSSAENGWPINNFPTQIGQPWGGGYYGGKITEESGTQYYLIVSPKSTEMSSSLFSSWSGTGDYGLSSANSAYHGKSNTDILNALNSGGSPFLTADFVRSLYTGGYSDWYIPAKNELEVLYYNLKPSSNLNDTGSGANANAISPEPFNANYTTSSPAQTSISVFRSGGSQAFDSSNSNFYWSSTATTSRTVWVQSFGNGSQGTASDGSLMIVRAIRRIPV
jgi:hypothetical protein